MSENPPEHTKQIFNETNKSSFASQHGDEHHKGRLPSLDPQAPAFVPGAAPAPASGAPAPGTRSQEAVANNVNSGRHSTRGSRGGGEGGLSRALRGTDRESRHSEQLTEQCIATDSRQASNQASAAPAAADASPLGRSPSSRAYLPANHLLNFRLANPFQQGRGGRGIRGTRGSSADVRRHPAYDRNQFLQANFRFLVSDAADLRRHTVDADLMLDWDDVVEVEMPVAAPVQCPISLETPPHCPQITPCGHVFGCAAMMAHLLSHGGPSLRKASPCPLCFAPVAARELRLLRMQPIEPFTVGGEATFQLLHRSRASVVPQQGIANGKVLPEAPVSARNGAWPHLAAEQDGQDGRAWDAGSMDYERHSKFTLLSNPMPLWVSTVQELAKLAVQVTAEGGQDAVTEAPAIYAALDAIAARAASWAERRQRQLLQVPGVDEAALPSPEEAAAVAAAAVKQASEQAAAAAEEARQRASVDARRDQEYPSLGNGGQAQLPPAWQRTNAAAPGGGKGQQAAASPGMAASQHRRASLQENAQAAFSDEDASPVHAAQEAAADLLPELDSASLPQPAPVDMSGSSPPTQAPAQPAREFYLYQVADGQRAFLSSLDLRVLAAAHGSLPACPPTLQAPIIGLEHMVQTEATRRRFKHLAHLPLTGGFTLVDIDVAKVVPADAVEPFAKELAAREARREKRAAQEADKRLQETAREAALAAHAAAPNASELLAMPKLGRQSVATEEERQLEAALQQSLAQAGPQGLPGTSPPAPQQGISFANMTRMGFAATGPIPGGTGYSPPATVWGPRPGGTSAAAPSSTPQGPWGGTVGASGNLAARLSAAPTTQKQQGNDPGPSNGSGKKGKKSMVLLSTGQRRY